AFGELLAALTSGLDPQYESSALRGTFERLLRRIVPVRTIRLRDLANRWSAHEVSAGVESIVLELPGTDPAARRVLEATFDPGCPLGEWDFQMLGHAAHLGALVLEVERTRAQLARARLLTGVRQKRDGAAPLIGSTPVMQALRSTIERV